MKKIITRIITVLFLGLMILGCEKWEEYDNPALPGAPDPALELVSVQDSTINVSVTTNVPGYVSMVITADTSLTEQDIDGELLLIGNISGIESQLFEMESAGTIQHSFSSGLIQNKMYQVFAVASNEDGMYSSVKKLEVRTDDNYAPKLVSTTPSKSTEAAQENSFSVELKFSEPVQLVNKNMFSFSYYFDDETIPVDSVAVDGNIVTVYQTKLPYNGEWVFLSWEEGAVTDYLAGTPNKVEAQTSGVIEEEIAGLYWRVEHVPFEMDSTRFVPATGSSVSEAQFDIMYNFPYAVSFPEDEYEEGDVSITFWQEGKKVVLDVPFDHLSISDDTVLVVSLPEAADYGNWVSVNIAEGVVVDTYENPNAAFVSDSETGAFWLISYNRDISLVAGTYKVTGTEYFSEVAEEYDVTIWVNEETEGQVFIKGLFNSTDTITGMFNKDFSTLTINDEELLGEIAGEGSEVVFANPFGEGKSVGFVDANGNTSMPIGSYDYTAGGWFKAMLSSTWTKQ